MKYLIKNGTVISSSGRRQADILTEGEKILRVEKDISDPQAVVVDASGCEIYPGFIDPHTHFDLDAGDFHTADDFYTGTRAALAGGTTVILDFTTQERGESLSQALENWHEMADGKCSCDYGFHMSITDWNPDVKREIPEMTRQGVTSYKLYMAYDNLRVRDREIFEILSAVEQEGGIVGVHCENGDLVTALTERLKKTCRDGVRLHPLSRPPLVEAEAVHRLLTIAQLADTAVNIVHLSTGLGLLELERFRQQGVRAFAETCPQYLILDDSLYELPGFEGAAYVLSPPLRKKEDVEALWKAVEQGEITTLGTDHCSFHMKTQKVRGLHDFTRIPNGIPGVEHRPQLFYQYGVVSGRTTPEMMCRMLSENPARLYGLYPRKGVIAPGSDADLVIWDPDRSWTITAESQYQNADYTPYEGFTGRGCPREVFLRGIHAVSEGKVLEEKRGEYLSRKKREM